MPSFFPEITENQTNMQDKYSTNPSEIIVKISTPVIDSEDSEDDVNEEASKIDQIKNPDNIDKNKLKEDPKESFSQFDKSISERGINLSKLGTESMMWDHEGMDEELISVCTHVSDGEKDEKLLKTLKVLDPCEEYDDQAFSERVQEFLRNYTDNMEKQKERENDSDCLAMSVKDPENPKSPEQKNPGVARKSVVRFQEELEECSSPFLKQHPPRRSWYPTPIDLNPPGAMSTPFPSESGIQEIHADYDESSHQRKLNYKPRKLEPDSSQGIVVVNSSDSTNNGRINVDIPYIPSESYPVPDLDLMNPGCLKICSWNIAGIRALIKKNGFDYIKQENPDILALQEVKCNEENLPSEAKLEGYRHYFLEGVQKGYCGVALFSKVEPINIIYGLQDEKLDIEARVITGEYNTFFLINVYAPFSGDKLLNLSKRLKWNTGLQKFIQGLNKKKRIIICGDFNVAHEEKDLAEPEKNQGIAGFTQQEKDEMTKLLKMGFVDSFRLLYPQRTEAYTFWPYPNHYRDKNIG